MRAYFPATLLSAILVVILKHRTVLTVIFSVRVIDAEDGLRINPAPDERGCQTPDTNSSKTVSTNVYTGVLTPASTLTARSWTTNGVRRRSGTNS